MENQTTNAVLPPIPAKRYFTIGEVSELCGVKSHVLRYWEQEFTQLKPVKRGGNRRYYQHHEVMLIRRIRQLLYEEGFTISGARSRLDQSEDKHEEMSPIVLAPADFNISALRRDLDDVLSILQNAVAIDPPFLCVLNVVVHNEQFHGGDQLKVSDIGEKIRLHNGHFHFDFRGAFFRSHSHRRADCEALQIPWRCISGLTWGFLHWLEYFAYDPV